MNHYLAKSVDTTAFTLTEDGIVLGELKYSKWYSFSADIFLPDNSKYQLIPKGFWDSTVELKKNDEVVLSFKMGWKGIIINTYFDKIEKGYILKLKSLWNSKYVLLDSNEKEFIAVETDFNWSKLRFDYMIETSGEFDNFNNKEVFLLTIIHCINYYLTMIAASA